MYAFAYGTSIIFGLTSLFLGSNENEALAGAAVVAVLIVVIWTFLYCSSRSASGTDVREALIILRRAIFMSGAVSAAGMILGLRTQQIEAAIIKRKLQRYVLPDKIDANALEVVTSTIKYANASNIALDSKMISSVADSIVQAERTGHGDFRDDDAHQVTQFLADTQSSLQAKVNHQARSYVAQGNVFPDLWAFINSKIMDLPIIIDRRVFVDTLLLGCTVTYNGGPVIVRNTAFENCKFEVVNTEAGMALLAEIAHGNPVNFSYHAEELPKYENL